MSPVVQPKRPYVLSRAPRNFGGSATFFLPKVLVTSTAARDGFDHRGSLSALAGHEYGSSTVTVPECWICRKDSLNLQLPPKGGRHIDESVFAFILNRKSGQFLNSRISKSPHHLVWCTARQRCLHTGVEYCLFELRPVQSLRFDKRNGSTLLFCIFPPGAGTIV